MAEDPDRKDPPTWEYVDELRRKADGHRLKAQEAEQRLEAERTSHAETRTKLEGETAARAAAETAGIEARKSADGRVVNAELRAAAREAGLIDIDVLKLVEIDKIKINDKGEPEGLTEVLDAFKASKPHFFKAQEGQQTSTSSSSSSTSSTSSTTNPPPAKPPGVKHASEMTQEEYAAARAQFNKPRIVA